MARHPTRPGPDGHHQRAGGCDDGPMLAYLFWHEPHEDVDADAYVERLQAFHRALAAAPPPSFVRSWSVRLAAAPWDDGRPSRSRTGTRRGLARARDAERGRGPRPARHRPRRGRRDGDERRRWAVPAAARDARRAGAVGGVGRQAPGRALDVFEPRLRAAVDAAGGGAVLRRQMVLGPAPEYALLAGGEPAICRGPCARPAGPAVDRAAALAPPAVDAVAVCGLPTSAVACAPASAARPAGPRERQATTPSGRTGSPRRP